MTAPTATSATAAGAGASNGDPPGAVTSPPVVTTRALGRRFGGVEALRDVNLSVSPGQVHALIGANGAGKSTLLRTLAGLIDPTCGAVRVAGGDPRDRRVRARIGLLGSSDRGFYLRLSGRENLIFFARMQGLRRGEARRRSDLLLERVGLGEAARRRAGLYSRGMLRRLAVARALLADPEVLLLDEATHDLDPDGADRVRRLTRRSGAAVVWATQRLGELERFADSVTVLVAGRTAYQGPVAQLIGADDRERYVVHVDRRGGGSPTADEVVRSAGGRVAAEDGLGAGVFLIATPRATPIGDVLARLHRDGLVVRSVQPERSGVEAALLRLSAAARR